MKEYSPALIRNACTLANHFRKCGILFVAIPILNDEDLARYHEELDKQIKRIEEKENA